MNMDIILLWRSFAMENLLQVDFCIHWPWVALALCLNYFPVLLWSFYEVFLMQ